MDKIKKIIYKLRFRRPPIIIGGCARSGTTLLLSILSSQPSIYTIPEETWAFCQADMNLDKFVDRYINFKDIPIIANRWCEKTPKNICYIGKIMKIFNRRVKIIHIVRDGRDVVLSRHPKDTSKYWVSPKRWVNDVKAGLKYINDPNVYTIKYEDIILNFDKTIRGLCKFLGISYNTRIKNWYKYSTKREDVAWFETVQPIHSNSIGKYKRHLKDERVRYLMENHESVNLLKGLNYYK